MMVPENTMMISKVSVKEKHTNKASGSSALPEGPDHLMIIFEHNRSSTGKAKFIRLIRPLKDKFSATLSKLGSKLMQEDLMSMSLAAFDAVTIGLDNNIISDSVERTNEEVFYDPHVLGIRIGNDSYKLIKDAPECTSLKLMLDPIVGCPFMASYDLSPELLKSGMKGWDLRGSGIYYIPKEEDVGKYVCVVLDLDEDTVLRCAVAKKPVYRVTEQMIFEERQSKHCCDICREGFRIMSYNILADLYLNLRQEQESLYYPYCPKQYQEYPYRYPVLLRELSGYNADLIFLQEVDERFRRRFLIPFMECHGFNVFFKRKGMAVSEGLAVCIRKEKFRIHEVHDIWLPDLLDQNLFPENSEIVRVLDKNPDFKTYFSSRPAVIQLLSLKPLCDEGIILLAANTHLHSHWQHLTVKLLQALLCTRYIGYITRQLQQKFPDAKIYRLFAGDFNNKPDGPLYEMIHKGSISSNHECWQSGTWGGFSTDAFLGDFVSNFLGEMSSLAADPEFTNYTTYSKDGSTFGFAGCLDYIWGDNSIKVLRTVPIPSEELLKKYVALPSKISASDHLPLICDIKLEG